MRNFRRKQFGLAFQRLSHGEARTHWIVDLVRHAGYEAPKRGQFFRFNQGVLGLLQIS